MHSSKTTEAGQVVASNKNLVCNHDFAAGSWQPHAAEVLPGWKIQQPVSSDSIYYTLENDATAGDRRIMKIEIPAVRQQVARLLPTQLYFVEPASIVTVTCRYRASAYASGAEAALWIELYDAQQAAMATSTAKRTVLPSVDDWTWQTITYQVPDDDPAGYYVGFFFRQINPGSLWVEQASLTVQPGRGRFLANAAKITPVAAASSADVTTEAVIDEQTFAVLLCDQGFTCSQSSTGILQVTAAGELLQINAQDGAVITRLTTSAVCYPHHGQGGFFRDLFWLPEEARWNQDASSEYQLLSCRVTSKGKLQIVFQRELQQAPMTGMMLRKKYLIDQQLRHLTADITIVNNSPNTVELRYWSWHRLAMVSQETIFACQGDPDYTLSADSPEHVFLKPHFSQWVKVSDRHYFGWDRAQLSAGGTFLDRLHLWNAATNPALGLIGKPVDLAPGGIFRARLVYHAIQEPLAQPAALSGDFRLMHPYDNDASIVCRASLHNHSQYHPGYTHAPVRPADLLTLYRDCDCQPRYKIVSITDHSRLTLPENTDPVGQSVPPWGVEDILCVPGGELGLGHRRGTVAGDLYGEIICIGLPKDNDDPTNQQQFYHEKVSKGRPSEYLQHLVDGGIFVGLSHPNCQLDADGVERWTASGYNYDELDAIFGNPEKGIPTLKQVPQGLEIGNQGYDFTARTNFINAEKKWDMLLTRGFKLHGICTDDTHGRPAFRGWVVMFLQELTEENFMQNLLQGHFYASQGPKITEIKVLDKSIMIKTDKPGKITFIGKHGITLQQEEDVRESIYTVRGDEIYVRAKVTRECPESELEVGGGVGLKRSAWTNPIYLESLNEANKRRP